MRKRVRKSVKECMRETEQDAGRERQRIRKSMKESMREEENL